MAQNSKEICVLCKEPTEYKKGTPICERRFYVKGVGQLCLACFQKTYNKNDIYIDDVDVVKCVE